MDPAAPIGVVVAVGIKSAKSGAPVLKDRFWFMSRNAASKEFAGSGRAYKALSREIDPAFEAWNRLAKGTDSGKIFDRRVCVIRGNIVHGSIEDAVMWNRSAHRLPEPNPNPASLRPACEGNGIWARRFRGSEGGQEIFEEMPCPNEACPFAQDGKTCKVFASLLFQLRWDAADPFEAHFPRTLAMWSTRGIYSARNLLGLFEYVLGTDAVMPRDADGERPPDWKPGLAAEMGIPEPSLFGMPFVMQVGEKTSPGRDGREGRRFPVVTFSPDGDLMAWLVHQRQQRELAAGGDRPALPAYVSTRAPEYMERIRHEARVELDPAAGELSKPQREFADAVSALARLEGTPGGPAAAVRANGAAAALGASAPLFDAPVLLSPAKCANLRKLAAEAGDADGSGLALEAARLCGSGSLEQVPAGHEADLMKWISGLSSPPKSRRAP